MPKWNIRNCRLYSITNLTAWCCQILSSRALNALAESFHFFQYFYSGPNPTHQKLKNLDPAQPNPTHGWTQAVDNSAYTYLNGRANIHQFLSSIKTHAHKRKLGPDLQNILRLFYDNAKVTINLWRTSNSQNILQWMESFSWVRFTCKIVISSEIVFVN